MTSKQAHSSAKICRKRGAYLCMALLLAAALTPGLQPSAAAWAGEPGASPWAEGIHSRARLLAGGRQGGVLLAGVEIEMDKGWKTYWRTPGDSGLPPFFDWEGSANLQTAEVLWPAPRRFTDASGTFAGYKTKVVFPVRVRPARTGAPVDLKLNLQYAVCADICVPAEANLALSLAASNASGARAIAAYLDRVPARLAKPDGVSPAVKTVTADLADPKPHLIVEAVYPGGTAGADLLVEGPQGVYVPPAKKLDAGQGGGIRYRVDLGGPKDLADLKGHELIFTVLSDTGQSETAWRVP